MYKKDRYLKLDKSPHSPHTIIPSLIKDGTEVLDVGCNTGFLAQTLRKRKILTDGIDINENFLKIAKKHSRSVFRRNLYDPQLHLGKRKYDYIIFSDILEHLPRPDLILINSKKHLKKQGKVIASIPNIARIEIRLQHLFGNFDYRPGIMGEDHLRFFTKRTGGELFYNCGYIVQECVPTGLGHRIHIFQTLTAFQFIYVAKMR